jgi:hypothetical protein
MGQSKFQCILSGQYTKLYCLISVILSAIVRYQLPEFDCLKYRACQINISPSDNYNLGMLMRLVCSYQQVGFK